MTDTNQTPETPLMVTAERAAQGPPRVFLFFTRKGLVASVGLLGLCLLALLFFASTGYGYASPSPAYVRRHTRPLTTGRSKVSPRAVLERADRTLGRYRPHGVFVVISKVENRLWIRNGDKVLLEAVVSAGAGSVLDDPKSGRHWVFDTPVGRFYVRDKRRNPVWVAPDWDYIESGEPLPRNYGDRIQTGMLGEYALDLGGGPSGYMIHGTLYNRLLGRNVSHGCIRVGRDDLRVVWRDVPTGATVFMY